MPPPRARNNSENHQGVDDHGPVNPNGQKLVKYSLGFGRYDRVTPEEAKRRDKAQRESRFGTHKPKISDEELLAGTRNGTWLSRQKFPDLQHIVPGMVPEGATLLAGAPKIGKSTLVRRIGLECSRGGTVFGIQCERRHVFYLALEDTDASMQASCREMLGENRIPAWFEYKTSTEPGYLIETTGAFLRKYPNGLVMVDTLGRAMEPAERGETPYGRDYRIASSLMAIYEEHPGSAIIVNAHSRKAKSEDFVEMVSGTNAIAGAVHTVAMLVRKRGTPYGTWHCSSRLPMEDAEYALILERPIGWRLDGDSLEEAAENVGMNVDRRGARSMAVIAFVNEHPEGVTAGQVLAGVDGIPDIKQARAYLSQAVERGDIRRMKTGVYGPNEKLRVISGQRARA